MNFYMSLFISYIIVYDLLQNLNNIPDYSKEQQGSHNRLIQRVSNLDNTLR
jgi:hypothetical protein